MSLVRGGALVMYLSTALLEQPHLIVMRGINLTQVEV